MVSLREDARVSSNGRLKKEKKRKRKTRYSTVWSSSTIKKVLNFNNIKYHIIFFITQISGQ